MIWRVLSYVGVAAGIVGLAVWLNLRKDATGVVRYHIDPEAAMSAPSHNHAITETACECDPDQEIKQALADRADYSQTHRELGDGFYARARYEEAKHRYQRAVEQDESNALAQYGLGMVYMKLAEFEKARACFQRAVEADRRLAKGYVALGLSYYCQGDFEKAQRQWEAVLKLEPKHAYATALLKSLPRFEEVRG